MFCMPHVCRIRNGKKRAEEHSFTKTHVHTRICLCRHTCIVRARRRACRRYFSAWIGWFCSSRRVPVVARAVWFCLRVKSRVRKKWMYERDCTGESTCVRECVHVFVCVCCVHACMYVSIRHTINRCIHARGTSVVTFFGASHICILPCMHACINQ